MEFFWKFWERKEKRDNSFSPFSLFNSDFLPSNPLLFNAVQKPPFLPKMSIFFQFLPFVQTYLCIKGL